ncbi:hypothetical protein HID58_084380 [Brassica napus]|uniref:SAM domain-containing protein n=1 Tax=Brassica napus TaxID=3708 RepID=A0ABQ7XJK3_BRANA|nr:hypothetical protein HID58_084380 [Brassica napus]
MYDEEEHRVFRMRRNDKMSKVMERYNDARGAELGTYVFLSEGGSMINKDKTPDEMEIKDGDQIDAMLHQHGGFGPSSIKQTVKNRLNGGSGDFSSHGGRQDGDKWEHDLFNDDKPRLSNRRVDPKDLRLKLQKKHHGLQTRLGGASLDLRQKLSGIKNPQPRSTGNLPNAIREDTRPAVMNVSGETKAASNKAIKKKPQQADTSVHSFLESLGLEKYSTSFQVEEVDMDALMHMTDDDLKALLIPMGPRKKILLAFRFASSLG